MSASVNDVISQLAGIEESACKLLDAAEEEKKKLYQDYSRRKFKVAQFHSGAGSLYDATRDLLLFNRKRIAEIENRREKSLENPNLSASYSGSFPIQC